MDAAMIYRGDAPHPAHRGFADSIDADILGLDRFSLPFESLRHSIPEEVVNGAFLPDYEIYIAEGTRALYGSITRQIISDSTLIYLAGDQALYKLLDESYELEVGLNRFISRYGMGALKRLFNRYINGIIAVSDFSAEYTSQVLPDKPMRIANPYIRPALFEGLADVSPQLDQNVAVTVGAYSGYKGQDLLVDAWETVREIHPDAELLLVGSGYPERFNDLPGVRVMGYVDDLTEVLSRASLYVQPSRVDNFPVSVLEALRAGLPALVTETTGNNTVVREISDEFVVETTSDALASGINRYFHQPLPERETASIAARQHGKKFDSQTRKQTFKTEFYNLVSELGLD